MTGGALEILKWLALVLMTGDHIDAALFHRSFGWLTELGRVAMPIFAAVIAFNLARPGIKPKLPRIRDKLLVVGAIAYPFHVIALGQGVQTLNILFAFAVAVQCVIWIRRKDPASIAQTIVLLAVSGLFLEFGFAAPLLTLAWWNFYRDRIRIRAGVLVMLATGYLCLVNGNVWAMASVPVVLLLLTSPVGALKRRPALFWIYYPAHLALLAGIAWYLHPAVFNTLEPAALNAAFTVP